jgi:hypothetical protein
MTILAGFSRFYQNRRRDIGLLHSDCLCAACSGDDAGPGEVELGKLMILPGPPLTTVAGGRGESCGFSYLLESHMTYLSVSHVLRSWPGIWLRCIPLYIILHLYILTKRKLINKYLRPAVHSDWQLVVLCRRWCPPVIFNALAKFFHWYIKTGFNLTTIGASWRRWAHFLEKQLSITVYSLPTKENKCLFSVSFCSKQIEFVVSVFRLQKTNRNCSFPLVLFSVWGIPETWRHGRGDKETWRHGDMVTKRDMDSWRHSHGDMETWRYGEMETWRQDMET